MPRRQRRKSTTTTTASVEAPLPVQEPEGPAGVSPDEAERRKRDDDEYAKYRESIVKLEQETGREVDRTVLAVASLALGLCLTIVKDVVKPGVGTLHAPWALYSAAIAFALPIVLLLMNLQCSNSAALTFRTIIDAQYARHNDCKDFWGETTALMNKVRRIALIGVFNWISTVCCIFGVLLLAVFAYFNLSEVKSESVSQTAISTGTSPDSKPSKHYVPAAHPARAATNPATQTK